jgi:hypothetical protein
MEMAICFRITPKPALNVELGHDMKRYIENLGV